MPNMCDYLRWRGDLSLAERPFNDVDNLLLASLSYIDFTDIVPGPGGGAIRLSLAVDRLLERADEDISPYVMSLANLDADYLRALASSRRFGGARLHSYVDIVDDSRKIQFAALQADVSLGQTYVSFRGTDSTLVGWEEDFMLSFQVTPAQRRAADYLADALRDAQREGTTLLVGGHSKGGNLAAYAAVACPVDLLPLIGHVWSNDGPGMAPEACPAGAYDVLGERFSRIQPTYSVIGQILDRPDVPRTYVASDASGMLQHDPMTWQVLGDSFVEEPGLMAEAALLDEAFAQWIDEIPLDQRESFTRELFGVLGAGGATDLSGVAASGSLQRVLQAMGDMSEESRVLVNRLIELMVGSQIQGTRDAVATGARQVLESARAAARGIDWSGLLPQRTGDSDEPVSGEDEAMEA